MVCSFLPILKEKFHLIFSRVLTTKYLIWNSFNNYSKKTFFLHATPLRKINTIFSSELTKNCKPNIIKSIKNNINWSILQILIILKEKFCLFYAKVSITKYMILNFICGINELFFCFFGKKIWVLFFHKKYFVGRKWSFPPQKNFICRFKELFCSFFGKKFDGTNLSKISSLFFSENTKLSPRSES